jgi:hypothetical protein
MSRPDLEAWETTLAVMEAHLGLIELALAGEGEYPGEYHTTVPNLPLPSELVGRARVLEQRQGDLAEALRARVSAFGTFIYAPASEHPSVSHFVDVRS